LNGYSTTFESSAIQASGLIVTDYSAQYHHWEARKSLSEWLCAEKVPALAGLDTRALTRKLRESGTMPAKIEFPGEEIPFHDPNRENLVTGVSIPEPQQFGEGKHRILLIDYGCKNSILRSLLEFDVQVLRVPWNYDIRRESFDAVVLSSGPGDPSQCDAGLDQIRNVIEERKPLLGICLGHQILARAIGIETYKLKYGHRSQNQPVREVGSDRCFITSQNHGFAVRTDNLPSSWKPWFENLNDGTNEGLIHESGLFMSIQFHPEASPGPVDTRFLFERFFRLLCR
jgi:carbamoyl-phosphate synthase small subunit